MRDSRSKTGFIEKWTLFEHRAAKNLTNRAAFNISKKEYMVGLSFWFEGGHKPGCYKSYSFLFSPILLRYAVTENNK